MDSDFLAVLQSQKPVENYLKIIPPILPIFYCVQSPSEQQSIIVINHPKTAMKKATIQTRQTQFLEEINPIKEDEDDIAILPEKREINIISVFIMESQ